MKLTYLWTGIAALLTLSACHTTQNYDDYLESWVGRSEADLVATWGAPVKMQDLGGGRQLFTYIKQKTVFSEGVNPQNVNFGTDSVYNSMNDGLGQETLYYCETTFTTENDIIVDYSWAGDACVK